MTTYARRLGLMSGTMAVVGGIIGAGIFRNPAVVAARVATPELTLLVWALGGMVALAGAFCFAELGARKPKAGGSYVYLRDAFGPLPAFLYGWALLLVISTGATAGVAMTFASYSAELLHLPRNAHKPLGIGAIALLSGINYLGVKPGAIAQNVLTLLKLAGLGLLMGAGLFMAVPERAAETASLMPHATGPTGFGIVIAVGSALVPVLFTYGGWQQTNYVAEEMIDAERNLPRALTLGVCVVVLVYLAANLAYLRVLGAPALAASDAPAADAMRILLGDTGATLIGAAIALSTFGFLGLVIMVTPRVYQAIAADGLLLPAFAELHPVHRTPTRAIALQAAWAIVLALSGSYGQLVDYVVFGDWIFFGLTVATLFVYRARDRRLGGNSTTTGFRTPAYPFVPALFVIASVYVVVSSAVANPSNALIGGALLLSGVPVFYFWKNRTGK
ncbi:MAG TPA: amino acid permease [Polyangiaceae bacterium]|nr:amino acid permease [Polyangiaceae bacterium]